VKVLIDTNIILDFLWQREPFQQEAEELFQAIDSGFASSSVPVLSVGQLLEQL
jgi:predicted nucleic acid-binding protein